MIEKTVKINGIEVELNDCLIGIDNESIPKTMEVAVSFKFFAGLILDNGREIYEIEINYPDGSILKMDSFIAKYERVDGLEYLNFISTGAAEFTPNEFEPI